VKRARAIGAACALACIVACGAPQSGDHVRQDKREEIIALWTQIRQWRHDAQLSLEPPQVDLNDYVGRSPRDARNVCPVHHEVPVTCANVCNLSDAICDNEETICKLADELGKDDDFAQGKCTNAKASCSEAKQKCCKCSAQPSTTTTTRLEVQ
jgi:hypothetical protein